MPTPKNQIHINGMYEGSLFYEFRFQNYNKVKNNGYSKLILAFVPWKGGTNQANKNVQSMIHNK